MARVNSSYAAMAAFAVLGYSLAMAADALKPAPESETQNQPTGNSFEALDKNHDGKISKNEAQSNDKLLKLFSGLDGDKDGALSRGEYAAYEPAGATKNL